MCSAKVEFENLIVVFFIKKRKPMWLINSEIGSKSEITKKNRLEFNNLIKKILVLIINIIKIIN